MNGKPRETTCTQISIKRPPRQPFPAHRKYIPSVNIPKPSKHVKRKVRIPSLPGFPPLRTLQTFRHLLPHKRKTPRPPRLQDPLPLSLNPNPRRFHHPVPRRIQQHKRRPPPPHPPHPPSPPRRRNPHSPRRRLAIPHPNHFELYLHAPRPPRRSSRIPGIRNPHRRKIPPTMSRRKQKPRSSRKKRHETSPKRRLLHAPYERQYVSPSTRKRNRLVSGTDEDRFHGEDGSEYPGLEEFRSIGTSEWIGAVC